MKPNEENMFGETRRLTQPRGGGAKSRRVARNTANERESMNGADVNTELINREDGMPVITTSRPLNRRNRRPSPRRQQVEDGASDRITSRTGSDRESSGSSNSVAGKGALRGTQLDILLRSADDRGAYKRFLILWWLVPVCLVVPCAYLNVLLMVQVPVSNCTLPPPPGHLSRNDWRLLITPRTHSGELNPCQLYDFPSALSDPQYDPGTRKQYSTRNDNSTHDNHHYSSTPQSLPSTPEDTGSFEPSPGPINEGSNTQGVTSSPVDSYTTVGDTGTGEDVGKSESSGITKSTEEHPGTQGQQEDADHHLNTHKEPFKIQHHHNTTDESSTTSNQQGDAQHLNTHKERFSTATNDSSTPNHQGSTRKHQPSTQKRHPSTPTHMKTKTHRSTTGLHSTTEHTNARTQTHPKKKKVPTATLR